METLIFSYNWNNKLNCDSFTTIRLHNQKKYQPQATFKIQLKQKKEIMNIGIAKVQEVYPCRAHNLSEHACLLDTGYSKAETINIIKNMYKNMSGFNIDTTVLDLIVLKKIKQPTMSVPIRTAPIEKQKLLEVCPHCDKPWNHLEVQSQHCDLCNYPENED